MAAPATGCGSKRGPAASSKEDRGTTVTDRNQLAISKTEMAVKTGAGRTGSAKGVMSVWGSYGFSVKPATKLTNFHTARAKRGPKWRFRDMSNTFQCALYPFKGCDTCGFSCYNEKKPHAPCESWKPCRGAHPSTPNPCEGHNDLCWPEACQKCPHALSD